MQSSADGHEQRSSSRRQPGFRWSTCMMTHRSKPGFMWSECVERQMRDLIHKAKDKLSSSDS